MENIKQIISFKTPLYKFIHNNIIIETECLFGENFTVNSELKEWSFGTLSTDNYKGWVKTKYLGPSQDNNHKVILKFSNIYLNPDPKSTIITYLSLGSKVNVNETDNDWAKVSFSSENKKVIGFIPINHLSKISDYNHDWIKIGNEMKNIPYVWGGRSSIGIDCSALLQLSIQTIGINLPRNTNNQISYMKASKKFKKVEVDFSQKQEIKKGLIIFWPGHVGIISKKNTLLHANAYFMKVCEENVYKVFSRLKGDNILPSFVFELIIP